MPENSNNWKLKNKKRPKKNYRKNKGGNLFKTKKIFMKLSEGIETKFNINIAY